MFRLLLQLQKTRHQQKGVDMGQTSSTTMMYRVWIPKVQVVQAAVRGWLRSL